MRLWSVVVHVSESEKVSRELSHESLPSSGRDRQFAETRASCRTLCVRKLPLSLDSDAVQEYLHNEFSPYGSVDIQIVKINGQRVALINFSRSSEARNAFRSKQKARIHDRLLSVEMWDESESYSLDTTPKTTYSSHYPPRDVNEMDLLVDGGGRGRRTSEQEDDSSRRGRTRTSRNFRSDRSRSPIPSQREPERQSYSRTKRRQEPSDLEENDPKATRTLFVGSLEPDITDSEVRDTFERFGFVEQIDVKRPNTSHAYAFVRFANVDMALQAKAKMSGKSVRLFHCKIGFGKPIVSRYIYISGLDNWASREELERFLLCFGTLLNFEWHSRKNYAIVAYQTPEIAEEATKQLKLLSFRRPEYRLIVDFIDPEGRELATDSATTQAEPLRAPLLPFSNPPFQLRPDIVSATLGRHVDASNFRFPLPFPNPFAPGFDPIFQSQMMRTNAPDSAPILGPSLLPSCINSDLSEPPESHSRRRHQRDQPTHRQGPPHGRRYAKQSRYRPISPIDNLLRPDLGRLGSMDPVLSAVVSMPDLDAFLGPSIWNGNIFVKKSVFKFRCLHAVGDPKIGQNFISDSGETNEKQERQTVNFQLLHQAIIDASWMVEAVHRINLAISADPPAFSVLLALPWEGELTKKSATPPPSGSAEKDAVGETAPTTDVEKLKEGNTERPLTCLVSYLRLKQRAALLTLFPTDNADKPAVSVNYKILLFTPSSFSLSLLKFSAPRLNSELAFVDDFLVMLVLKT
ncbi:dosage compensation by inactivation of X chromosome [Sparganum proliferum]